MQFMRNLTQTEPCFVGAEAICDREGQVLSVHAAPLGLSVGDYLTDRMTAAERRFFAGLSHDAICLCRKQAVLCLRRQFNGLLVRCIPLSAPPQAVAARKEQVSSLGLVLSPGLLALDALQTDDGEAAHELIRFCGMGLHAHGRLTAEMLALHLAGLPPLCARQLTIKQAVGTIPDGVWPVMLYCMAVFLCRGTSGSALELSLTEQMGLPMALLAADAPICLPSGRSRLTMLAKCFPDAPELALCNRLAAEHRIAVDILSDGKGRLAFAAEQSPDPAWFGFKQPVGFNGEATEAAEAEWCHLLRAAVLREK